MASLYVRAVALEASQRCRNIPGLKAVTGHTSFRIETGQATTLTMIDVQPASTYYRKIFNWPNTRNTERLRRALCSACHITPAALLRLPGIILRSIGLPVLVGEGRLRPSFPLFGVVPAAGCRCSCFSTGFGS